MAYFLNNYALPIKKMQEGGFQPKPQFSFNNPISLPPLEYGSRPFPQIPSVMDSPDYRNYINQMRGYIKTNKSKIPSNVRGHMKALGVYQSGGSIVDYLKENNLGQYSSLAERKKLGKLVGIDNVGTAEGNLALLEVLQNQGIPETPSIAPSTRMSQETFIDPETGAEVAMNIPIRSISPSINFRAIPKTTKRAETDAPRTTVSAVAASDDPWAAAQERYDARQVIPTNVPLTVSDTPISTSPVAPVTTGNPGVYTGNPLFTGQPLTEYRELDANGNTIYPGSVPLSPYARYKTMRESGDSPLRGTQFQGTTIDAVLQNFVTDPIASLGALLTGDEATSGEDYINAASIIPILKMGKLFSLGKKIPGVPQAVVSKVNQAFKSLGITPSVINKITTTQNLKLLETNPKMFKKLFSEAMGDLKKVKAIENNLSRMGFGLTQSQLKRLNQINRKLNKAEIP